MKLRNLVAKIILEHLNEQNDSSNNLNGNFWKWFGGSKVVSNGAPIVLYHGSKTEFSSFDDRKKGSSTDPGLRGRGSEQLEKSYT